MSPPRPLTTQDGIRARDPVCCLDAPRAARAAARRASMSASGSGDRAATRRVPHAAADRTRVRTFRLAGVTNSSATLRRGLGGAGAARHRWRVDPDPEREAIRRPGHGIRSEPARWRFAARLPDAGRQRAGPRDARAGDWPSREIAAVRRALPTRFVMAHTAFPGDIALLCPWRPDRAPDQNQNGRDGQQPALQAGGTERTETQRSPSAREPSGRAEPDHREDRSSSRWSGCWPGTRAD